jgi:hypothetical protein
MAVVKYNGGICHVPTEFSHMTTGNLVHIRILICKQLVSTSLDSLSDVNPQSH